MARYIVHFFPTDREHDAQEYSATELEEVVRPMVEPMNYRRFLALLPAASHQCSYYKTEKLAPHYPWAGVQNLVKPSKTRRVFRGTIIVHRID
jgi:hypothetical protein